MNDWTAQYFEAVSFVKGIPFQDMLDIPPLDKTKILNIYITNVRYSYERDHLLIMGFCCFIYPLGTIIY